ncbi:MAG: class I SAM-dependent methyltransferase [Chloroflexota bacterium]
MISQPNPTQNRPAVIHNELAWHEQEAHRRIPLDAILYDPPAFDAVVQPAVAFLRPAAGELVLDLGSGEGKETLELASRGLIVVSVDLSFKQLCRARQFVQERLPQAQVYFVQANAEELPFADRSFRRIYGKAVLHHLDLDLVAQTVERLLPPGGRATFAEPLARHPLIWLGRRLTPALRTRDEHPLPLNELRCFAERFQRPALDTYYLLAPLAYLFRILPGSEWLFRKTHQWLHELDQWLLRHFRGLQNFAWYGVIKFHKL